MVNKRVLITGAGGFVGANLIWRLLADGYHITATVRQGSENLWRLSEVKDHIEIVELELSDKDQIKNILFAAKADYIFHLASYGNYPEQVDVQKIFQTNVLGTVNLISAAEEHGFEKIVVVGSSSEYGAKPSPMKETDLLEPNTAYGVSKATSTLYAQHRAREEKLPITILRFFSVYGPWEKKTRLIPTLISRALKNETLEIVSGTVARDFVYVEDVVEALVAALQNKNSDRQVINICSGQQSTLEEVVNQVLTTTKSQAKIAWGKYEARDFDTAIWLGDRAKAKEFLLWEPKVSLASGIAKTTDWLKQHQVYYDRP